MVVSSHLRRSRVCGRLSGVCVGVLRRAVGLQGLACAGFVVFRSTLLLLGLGLRGRVMEWLHKALDIYEIEVWNC